MKCPKQTIGNGCGVYVPGCVGLGVFWCFHIYVGSDHFFVVKILNFNILGFSDKLIFLGDEDFVDTFRGHHKIGLYLGIISMHFRVFYKVKGSEWGYILGLLKLKNMGGGVEISVFFLGGGGER